MFILPLSLRLDYVELERSIKKNITGYCVQQTAVYALWPTLTFFQLVVQVQKHRLQQGQDLRTDSFPLPLYWLSRGYVPAAL
jgi:hypothetical protein